MRGLLPTGTIILPGAPRDRDGIRLWGSCRRHGNKRYSEKILVSSANLLRNPAFPSIAI